MIIKSIIENFQICSQKVIRKNIFINSYNFIINIFFVSDWLSLKE